MIPRAVLPTNHATPKIVWNRPKAVPRRSGGAMEPITARITELLCAHSDPPENDAKRHQRWTAEKCQRRRQRRNDCHRNQDKDSSAIEPAPEPEGGDRRGHHRNRIENGNQGRSDGGTIRTATGIRSDDPGSNHGNPRNMKRIISALRHGVVPQGA